MDMGWRGNKGLAYDEFMVGEKDRHGRIVLDKAEVDDGTDSGGTVGSRGWMD